MVSLFTRLLKRPPSNQTTNTDQFQTLLEMESVKWSPNPALLPSEQPDVDAGAHAHLSMAFHLTEETLDRPEESMRYMVGRYRHFLASYARLSRLARLAQPLVVACRHYDYGGNPFLHAFHCNWPVEPTEEAGMAGEAIIA